MTAIEVTVSISIPEDGLNLEALEDRIAHATQQAGQESLWQACKAMEATLLNRRKPGEHRNKRRSLHLLTRFGWIRLCRWQVRNANGNYHYPLDGVLELLPRQYASPWITAKAVALATRIPYRQATHLLSGFVEEVIDHRTLYHWVQQAGEPIVEEEEEQQEAVFVHGEIPDLDPQQREIVVAEVDGTFLKAQREETQEFEVRMRALAIGNTLESHTAKHRRYRLLERVCYGGVESAQDFGERLFLIGEKHLGLSHALHLLLIGDSAEWVEDLAGYNRWKATYHL